jgi:LacI family transcriptional regulator/LacI family repressor for deo operon, udp, cdd, tsx, nupC, and nupG
MPKRVTQADVARQAGVSRATVSLALKGHPSIPSATQRRIRTLAAKLGYAPDPLLSALAAYRTRHRPSAFQGTLAWLINSADGYQWQRIAQFRDYHAGAVARARRHGYTVETLDLSPAGMPRERLAVVLRARNINGLLLCPQPHSGTTLQFEWAEFSAVTFGYTLSSPHLHTVVSTQFRDMLQTMEELRLRGYRRIGLMLSREHDLRTNFNYRAAYLASAPPGPPPILASSYSDLHETGRWVRANRLDAVVACGGEPCLSAIAAAGLRAPRDLGLAAPNLARPNPAVAGVVENSTEIGAVAVDLVVAMLQRGERGVPPFPQRIHVEGEWHEARSVRPVARRLT